MAGYNNYPWYVNPYSYNNVADFPPNTQQNSNNYQQNPNSYQQNLGQNNEIKWVQGEAGARSFYVRPGHKQILMDSESNLFYIKICDVSGVPLPLRVFKYEEITDSYNNNNNINNNGNNSRIESSNNYVTREEFEEALAKLQKPKKEEKKNEFFV